MLDPYVLTIGFARRFATYKRSNLVFSDLERLLALINRPNRPVQIIFAGKAHPADEPGKELIQEVYRIVKKSENGGRLVFLEDYDMNLARYLVQGVDVWLNTPRRPNEASGNKGMKAAINGPLLCWMVGGKKATTGKTVLPSATKSTCPIPISRTTRMPRACTTPWKTASSRCTMHPAPPRACRRIGSRA
jgi:alpha-glucan phosphorylase-like protein